MQNTRGHSTQHNNIYKNKNKFNKRKKKIKNTNDNAMSIAINKLEVLSKNL